MILKLENNRRLIGCFIEEKREKASHLLEETIEKNSKAIYIYIFFLSEISEND